MKKIVSLAAVAAILGACATHPNNISAQYVSPLAYEQYDCFQLNGELQRVARKVNQISHNQAQRANNDTTALTLGLVLFWPALFFMANGDQKQELSQLKGEYDAINQAGIQKRCRLPRV